jgi:hypothetical protein
MEELLGSSSSDKDALRRRQLLPFEALEEVPTSGDDEPEERPFLMCPYNKADLTYRSPWTNMYYVFEKKGDGEEEIRIYARDVPEDEKDLRALEANANDVWEAYTQMYYGKEAIGSVFLRPQNSKLAHTPGKLGAFEGLFGIKKTAGNGSWDSVHLVKVEEPNEADKTCDYYIESQVVVQLNPYTKSDVSAHLTKETSRQAKVRLTGIGGSHLENIGKFIEDIEIEFRSRMERVDMPKTIEVVESIYKKNPAFMNSALFSGAGEQRASFMMMGGGCGTDTTPSMATGMGVGASMIGEIANKAKSKMNVGGPNPFMEAMKKNELKKQVSAPKEDTDTYVDMKATLKKGSPRPGPTKTVATAGVSPEFADFRNRLKKTGK